MEFINSPQSVLQMQMYLKKIVREYEQALEKSKTKRKRAVYIGAGVLLICLVAAPAAMSELTDATSLNIGIISASISSIVTFVIHTIVAEAYERRNILSTTKALESIRVVIQNDFFMAAMDCLRSKEHAAYVKINKILNNY